MGKKNVLIIVLLSSAMLFAQDKEKTVSVDSPWKKIEFSAGGYLTDITTEVRIGSDALGIGLSVDLERALGLETSSFIFKADGLFRFGKKQRSFVGFGYFGLTRKSEKVLATDIEFFDKTYTIGTKISSSTKLNIYQVFYGYSFLQDEKFEIGATIGFFVMPISLSLNAVNVNSTIVGTTDGVSFVAPLPNIGLYSSFVLSSKVLLRQSINLFYIKKGTFKGSLTELNMSLEYNAFKHVGFGLGINSFNLNFENKNQDYPNIDFKGQFGYKLSGVLLYVKGYF